MKKEKIWKSKVIICFPDRSWIEEEFETICPHDLHISELTTYIKLKNQEQAYKKYPEAKYCLAFRCWIGEINEAKTM